MRLVSVGAAGLMLLAGAVVYFVFFHLASIHLSQLVPEDAAFAVVYRSIEDVRAVYEGPEARRDSDPGQLRVGYPINVPELEGVAQHQPVAVYWTQKAEEVFVVPYRDYDAFEEAFDRNRENVNLRAPHRVAKNYLSVSAAPAAAEQGERNDLVLQALEYPIALAAWPRNAATVRAMLAYLFHHEPRNKLLAVPTLGRVAARLPTTAAAYLAEQCDDFLLGLKQPETGIAPVHVDLFATPAAGSALARTANVKDLDLPGLVGTFPNETQLLLGAVLDEAGWAEWGLPFGDAAVAVAILETPHRARRFTVLAAVRPRDSTRAARIDSLLPALAWKTVDVRGADVHSARLSKIPRVLRRILREGQKGLPPVYLATAVEQGVWYGAVGSQAEQAIRHALDCARGGEVLSLRVARAVSRHPGFFGGQHVAMALVTVNGVKAFGTAMPLFEIASLSQPAVVTLVIDIDKKAHGDLRIFRHMPARR